MAHKTAQLARKAGLGALHILNHMRHEIAAPLVYLWNGARSVKRLCVDRKLSLTERDALPALYVGGRLAAVWRLGTDVTFLPEGGDAACFVRITPR